MHFGFLHSFWTLAALGTIVVQGLGLLRMFVSLIFFLQLCLYINSSAGGAHARKYKKNPSSGLQQSWGVWVCGVYPHEWHEL